MSNRFISRFLVLILITVAVILCPFLACAKEVAPSVSVPKSPPPDKTPPLISTVNVSNITESSATITWTTNKPATSQTEYGTSKTVRSKTPIDERLSVNHTVILSNLVPSQNYYLKIMSVDSANNEGIYESERVFTTKQRPGFLTYTDTVNGFSFAHPQDWQDVTGASKDMAGRPRNIIAAFFSPLKCDLLHGVLHIGRDVPSKPINLDFYFDLNLAFWQTTLRGYSPLSKREITIQGKGAIEHVFESGDANAETPLLRTSLKVRMVNLFENNIGWNIMCISNKTCWDSFKSDFESMVQSFRIMD